MNDDSSRTTDVLSQPTAWVVFTDLDGTLLDRLTYDFEAARPALAALHARGIPLVPVTSKTRAEVAPLRMLLGTRGPYVVENGGAIVVPRDAFAVPGDGSRPVPDATEEDVLALGAPYADVVAALASASAETGVPVRGFASMDDAGVADATGLTLAEAARARRREHGEAFTILDAARADALLDALGRRGIRWTRGGRFHHAFAGNDKGAAVRWLAERYRARWPAVRTIGLGDAPNDAPMLAAVDVPVVVRGPHADALRALAPLAMVTEAAGPAGWNAAVLAIIGERPVA